MMNILIIEDHQADVELIKIYLAESTLRFRLFDANTLEGGLSLLRKHAMDVVLLDLSVGDSTGLNTLETWLQEAPETPVIVLTNLDNQRTGNMSVKLGAQDYIVKGTLDSRRLVDTINYSLERFKTEASLRQRNKELAKAKDMLISQQRLAGIGAWEMDVVNNAMRWGDETYALFGLTPGSLSPTRSDYLRLVYREDREKVEEFFDMVLKRGEASFIEHRIAVDLRTIKYILVRAQVKFDEESNRVLLVGSVQDVSDKRSESLAPPENTEHLPPDNNHLFRQLGHSVLSPLGNAINLLYQLGKTPLDETQQKLVGSLRESVDDLRFVFNNIVNYSLLTNDKEALNRQVFNLPELLETIRRVLQFKAEQVGQGIVFLVQDPLTPEFVYGDASKVSQYIYAELDQLLLLQHGKKTPEVTVSLLESNDVLHLKLDIRHLLQQPRHYEPYEFSNTDLVRLLSEDRTSHQHQRLLWFASAKLGLMLGAQRDVKLIKSRSEGRTLLTIPLLHAKNEGEQPLHNLPGPIRVLLVEDHPVQHIAAKQILHALSGQVEVVSAKNGREAVELARQNPFDLILMDLLMPEMDGITAIAQIREFSQTPIIAMTTDANAEEEARLSALGANDYLAKPFDRENLYQRIARQLYTPKGQG